MYTRPSARRVRPAPGTCSDCKRHRQVFPTSRYGGASYRSGGRWYRSSICGDCALDNLRSASPSNDRSHQYSVSSLDTIVASLGTEEAAEVFTAYRERRDQHKARQAARYAPSRVEATMLALYGTRTR